jgi:hypothetical protein
MHPAMGYETNLLQGRHHFVAHNLQELEFVGFLDGMAMRDFLRRCPMVHRLFLTIKPPDLVTHGRYLNDDVTITPLASRVAYHDDFHYRAEHWEASCVLHTFDCPAAYPLITCMRLIVDNLDTDLLEISHTTDHPPLSFTTRPYLEYAEVDLRVLHPTATARKWFPDTIKHITIYFSADYLDAIRGFLNYLHTSPTSLPHLRSLDIHVGIPPSDHISRARWTHAWQTFAPLQQRPSLLAVWMYAPERIDVFGEEIAPPLPDKTPGEREALFAVLGIRGLDPVSHELDNDYV